MRKVKSGWSKWVKSPRGQWWDGWAQMYMISGALYAAVMMHNGIKMTPWEFLMVTGTWPLWQVMYIFEWQGMFEVLAWICFGVDVTTVTVPAQPLGHLV